jgi:riboflavin kinase/FMN adenylyltransferase
MSIGNFDGLHLGHARILQMMKSLRSANGAESRLTVVTFEPHPLTVLRPELAPPRLTPYPMKQALLAAAGVEDLVVLAPSQDVLDLTAEQFWTILRDDVQPSHLVEGSSFNFGKGRGGTIQRLRQWTAESNVRLHVIEAVQAVLLDLHVVDVNSSLIRWLIHYGRVRDAAICLGRPYRLGGAVIRGYGRGKQIGVPTANLDCTDQFIPADGVYAGSCMVAGRVYAAAVSIGTMPTFGENQRQVEAHLIGFDGDLYDQVIAVDLIDWLRDQVRFASVDALKAQLQADFGGVIRAGKAVRPGVAIAQLSPA